MTHIYFAGITTTTKSESFYFLLLLWEIGSRSGSETGFGQKSLVLLPPHNNIMAVKVTNTLSLIFVANLLES